MNVLTERHDLTRRFNEMKENDGLLDMKFFLGDTSEATVEQVCGDVNHVLDLYKDNKARKVTTWGDKPSG